MESELKSKPSVDMKENIEEQKLDVLPVRTFPSAVKNKAMRKVHENQK